VGQDSHSECDNQCEHYRVGQDSHSECNKCGYNRVGQDSHRDNDKLEHQCEQQVRAVGQQCLVLGQQCIGPPTFVHARRPVFAASLVWSGCIPMSSGTHSCCLNSWPTNWCPKFMCGQNPPGGHFGTKVFIFCLKRCSSEHLWWMHMHMC